MSDLSSKELITAPENPTLEDLIAFYGDSNFRSGVTVRIPYAATRRVLEELRQTREDWATIDKGADELAMVEKRRLTGAIYALEVVDKLLRAAGYSDDSSARHNLGIAVSVLRDLRNNEGVAAEQSEGPTAGSDITSGGVRISAPCPTHEPWEAPGCDCPGIRKPDPAAHAPNCPYRVIKEIHGVAQPPRDTKCNDEQAEAWLAVIERMQRHNPRVLIDGVGTGLQLALREIDRLYSAATPPDVDARLAALAYTLHDLQAGIAMFATDTIWYSGIQTAYDRIDEIIKALPAATKGAAPQLTCLTCAGLPAGGELPLYLCPQHQAEFDAWRANRDSGETSNAPGVDHG